jgi:hypothetical protein
MTPNSRLLDRSADGEAIPLAYSPAMQAMHWATLVLLICAYVAAWMIDGAESRDPAAWLVMLHRSLGITILLVTAIRLAIRRQTRIPSLPADLTAIQRIAARTSAQGTSCEAALPRRLDILRKVGFERLQLLILAANTCRRR